MAQSTTVGSTQPRYMHPNGYKSSTDKILLHRDRSEPPLFLQFRSDPSTSRRSSLKRGGRCKAPATLLWNLFLSKHLSNVLIHLRGALRLNINFLLRTYVSCVLVYMIAQFQFACKGTFQSPFLFQFQSPPTSFRRLPQFFLRWFPLPQVLLTE